MGEGALQFSLALDLAHDVADDPAEIGVNGAAIFLKSGAAKFPSLAGLGCQPCG